ncbi:MAG: hypothetical protein ABEI75_01430 [Halobaculum sp.]
MTDGRADEPTPEAFPRTDRPMLAVTAVFLLLCPVAVGGSVVLFARLGVTSDAVRLGGLFAALLAAGWLSVRLVER